MFHLLLVGAGGFLGAIARYLVNELAGRWAGERYPLGTLLVNLAGCLAVGFVLTWWLARGDAAEGQRRFWVVGFLGGFTTFSAFGWEMAQLTSDGRPGTAVVHATVHLLGGVLLVWVGRAIALAVLAPR